MSAADGLNGRRILVVDDEEDVRTFLTTVLEDAGAEVLIAKDGEEAIAVAGKEKPDLITLDLSMPGRDGGEVYEAIRKDKDLEALPVCVITGRPELRKLIYDRDFRRPEGYLDKPVSEDDVLVNLRKILELGRKDGE